MRGPRAPRADRGTFVLDEFRVVVHPQLPDDAVLDAVSEIGLVEGPLDRLAQDLAFEFVDAALLGQGLGGDGGEPEGIDGGPLDDVGLGGHPEIRQLLLARIDLDLEDRRVVFRANVFDFGDVFGLPQEDPELAVDILAVLPVLFVLQRRAAEHLVRIDHMLIREQIAVGVHHEAAPARLPLLLDRAGVEIGHDLPRDQESHALGNVGGRVRIDHLRVSEVNVPSPLRYRSRSTAPSPIVTTNEAAPDVDRHEAGPRAPGGGDGPARGVSVGRAGGAAGGACAGGLAQEGRELGHLADREPVREALLPDGRVGRDPAAHQQAQDLVGGHRPGGARGVVIPPPLALRRGQGGEGRDRIAVGLRPVLAGRRVGEDPGEGRGGRPVLLVLRHLVEVGDLAPTPQAVELRPSERAGDFPALPHIPDFFAHVRSPYVKRPRPR